MNTIKRYCQALDLHDDPELIAEYEMAHHKIWPEIVEQIKMMGVEQMEIWRIGNRLFMIMDVNSEYHPEKARQIAKNNPINEKWEKEMWKYQVATPWAREGEKWVQMNKIFDLQKQ
ncbi:L-rhamnose mutarotase [Ignatzschineria sp. LJL83]